MNVFLAAVISSMVVASASGAHRYWQVSAFQKGGDASYYGAASIQMFETIGGPNVCVGGTPSANHNNAQIGNAFDGNPATIWYSMNNSNSVDITYDFGVGNAKKIRGFAWTAGSGEHRDNILQGYLRWSDDGVTWTTLMHMVTDWGWTPSTTRTWYHPELYATDHRYWRSLFAGDNVGNNYIMFTDVEFRPTVDVAQAAEGSSITNWTSWDPIANIFDGNINTIWGCRANESRYVGRDYGVGSGRAVKQFWMRTGNNLNGPGSVVIESGYDNITWVRRATSPSYLGQWAAFGIKTLNIPDMPAG